MFKIFPLLLLLLTALAGRTQSYEDSLKVFRANYVENHEVVGKDDRKHLDFFKADKKYRVKARVETREDSPWIPFSTSGKMKKNYRVYAVLHFTINDTIARLNLYQSQDLMNVQAYQDYLFLPFTDATTGIETYDSGRYLDPKLEDIRDGYVMIDFNKAYNPYCAYVDGVYNCPIPPVENRLSLALKAGEKNYRKH